MNSLHRHKVMLVRFLVKQNLKCRWWKKFRESGSNIDPATGDPIWSIFRTKPFLVSSECQTYSLKIIGVLLVSSVHMCSRPLSF